MSGQVQDNLQKLLSQIESDFFMYQFQSEGMFVWSPSAQRITYDADHLESPSLLLHELAHAELLHTDHLLDITLLQCEVEAWQYARHLAKHYNITIPEALVEECLDTYRLWLWKRSRCPVCNQGGLQRQKNVYSCINCPRSWRVNDARNCGGRRFILA